MGEWRGTGSVSVWRSGFGEWDASLVVGPHTAKEEKEKERERERETNGRRFWIEKTNWRRGGLCVAGAESCVGQTAEHAHQAERAPEGPELSRR